MTETATPDSEQTLSVAHAQHSDEPLLVVKDLATSFITDAGVVRAVDGVTFNIRRGEALGVVGESGSGKSVTARTIMRLFGLLDRPIVTGSVRLDNQEILTMSESELRRIRGTKVAMIFQDPMTSLDPVIPIGEQIAETIRYHQGASRREARQKSIDLLGMVGISDPARRAAELPHEFSGGMRQRVMIAMAISCEPDLLIADEPTTALDATVQAQVLRLLDRLRTELRMAMMVITHDFGVVASTCDAVQVMYGGRMVERGDLHHILERAKHPYTEGLLGLVPKFDNTATRLQPIPGQPPTHVGTTPGCAFAPRCAHAHDRCTAEAPPRFRIGPQHDAACWLVEPGAPRSTQRQREGRS